MYRNNTTNMKNRSRKMLEDVFYKIQISDRNIEGKSIMCRLETDIATEIASIMVYKQSTKFRSLDEYKESEIPHIDIQVTIQSNTQQKIYTLNENLLMYIYNYTFDEYYVESEYIESEYEISDWAISSPSSSSSSGEQGFFV